MSACLGSVAWGQPTSSPTPAASPAPTQSAVKAEEASDFKFNGYVQSSYSWNTNRPGDGVNFLQGYNELAGKLRLDLLDLNFQYALDQPDRTGFRLELVGGVSMPRIDAASGLFRDVASGSTSTLFDLRQAFVSHTFENGVRIDAGKFASHVGYEIMDGVDGRNPNATRALTFTYSPFTHTGVKLSYPISDELSVQGLLVLGADNWQDSNRSLSWGGQLNYHPDETFSLVFNYFAGPERAGNDRDQRELAEIIANWKFHEQLTLGLEAMSAREAGLAPQGGTAPWNSFLVYFLTQISDDFSLNFRQEWFNDPLGARLPVAGRVSGFTVTPEYRITPDWVVRMDFRFDRCDRPIYDRQGSKVDWQNTLFLGQSYRF